MTHQRKVVTVLFCDVADSTALGESRDPEAVRRLLADYFERMSAIVQRHEGVVEKFIGDAVMAVFGVPAAHEDDALRALRAAAQMREAFSDLGIEGRIGVNTGEVVVGTEERLATGDAVNVAARLEQVAAPGEILLGEATYRLVRNAVEARPVEALTLKGKAKPVNAFRLTALIEDAALLVRRFDSPFVGRAVELGRLRSVFERVVTDRGAALVTLVGPAGIGKTRVAAEFVAGLDGQARVLQGRCLSYGEGITFWPLQEILRTLRERPRGAPDPEQARSTEETFWAYRKLFEALAAEHPLVVLLEDVHWADPTLLDLLEHVIEWTRDAPMLLLCLARPEFLDERPGWPGERVELEPLGEKEVEALMAALADGLPPAARTRIAESADGNPLFAEQMVALAEENGREADVPPTIQSLLAARIDRLEPVERALFECAAVIGKEFWRGALIELSPPETQVSAILQRLIRKRLVRPEHSHLPGEDAFRFEHVLVRDVGYAAIAKQRRAHLHERFADWLERIESPYPEIIGYHLEQAYRYRAELGDAKRALAARAGATLARAGVDAAHRGERGGAANLLFRGLDLLPDDAPNRGKLLLARGDCLRYDNPREALAAYENALAVAKAAGDRPLAFEASIEINSLESDRSPKTHMAAEDIVQVEHAAAELEGLGHERGLARASWAVSRYRNYLGQHALGAEAAERAAAFAKRAGDWSLERASLVTLGFSLVLGPIPATEGTRRCEEILARTDDIGIRWTMRCWLYHFYAMLGHIDDARRLHELALADAEELGAKNGVVVLESSFLALAGAFEPPEVEEKLRRSLAYRRETGHEGAAASVAGNLALALCDQGRHHEADRYAAIGERLSASDDYDAQTLSRAARARILTHRLELASAESLAREAVAIADRTDDLHLRAWLWVELAEVLGQAQKTEEAYSVLESAIVLAEQKEAFAIAERARARLAELAEPLESASGSGRRS
jgi:class 3 adenylate cyclase